MKTPTWTANLASERYRLLGVHPLLWLGVAAFAAMTVFVITSPLPVLLDAYLHDDSFYYLKTARNFASGQGSSFDGINHTNGYHPAWFAILAAMSWSGVGYEQAVPVAMGIQAALFALGSIVLTAALTDAGVSALASAAAVCLVYFGIVPVLGWNVLESGAVQLASASVLWAFVRLHGAGISPFLLGVVLSAAFLSRLDHVFFLPIGAALLARRIAQDDIGAKVRRGVVFLAPVVILVGGYLLLNLATSGHLMTVSGRVKSEAPLVTLAELWIDLISLDFRQTWKLGLAFSIVLVVHGLWRRRITGPSAYAAGSLAIFAFYPLAFGEPAMAAYWYYIPLYTMSCLAIALGLQAASNWLTRERTYVSTIVMTVLVVVVLGMRGARLESFRRAPEGAEAAVYRLAAVLRGITGDRDVRIGAWDAGILGYYGGRVTNLDGLANSTEFFERYHSRDRVTEYIHEVGFQYIVCFEDYLSDQASGLLGPYRIAYTHGDWVVMEKVPVAGR